MTQVPDRAAETTSTIVLKSKKSYYVDIRIYKDALGKRSVSLPVDYPMTALKWAFAGKSQMTKGKTESDVFTPQHSIWEHWVDSKSNDLLVDEGDLWPQPNGDVLKIGKRLHPTTGLECEYEESWGDIMVEVVGDEKELVSIALVMEDSSRNAKGMVVRIGTYCQGILKIGEELTVERWKWSDANQHGAKDWSCTIRIGRGLLPCDIAINKPMIDKDTFIESGDFQWRVVENYHWEI